jgi:hypothetical protein
MSVTFISRVLAQAPVRGSRLNLLVVLADFANDQGVAWPSVATIAQRTRVSSRQAQRIIREMRDDGLLYVQAGTGRGHANRYCLLVGMEPELIPSHLVRCFPSHLAEVRAFCCEHDLLLAENQCEKGGNHVALSAQNQTDMSPFSDHKDGEHVTLSHPKGDDHVILSDQSPSTMSPFLPQSQTGMSPFADSIDDDHVTLSDQSPSTMSPFSEAIEQKGDIALSNEPSWNTCVVVDDDAQQSVSQNEQQPNERQPNKHPHKPQANKGSHENAHEPQANMSSHENAQDLVAYLKSQGMSVAAQFADIPYDVGRADFDARRADGIPVSHIVTAWRQERPSQEVNYLRPAPVEHDVPPPAPPSLGSRSAQNQPFTRPSRPYSGGRSSARARFSYSDKPIPDPKRTAAEWGLTLGG